MIHIKQLPEQQRKLLEQNVFFTKISPQNLQQILPCLGVISRSFEKNHFLFNAGDYMEQIGFLMVGKVYIIQEDFWGNRTILEQIEPGGMFGEAFACADTKKIPVSVLAIEYSEVLFFPYQKLLTLCPNACPFHQQLIANMLQIMAGKNVMLVQKMTHISKRNTREKLLSYLSAQALQQGKEQFTIPFNRQELADFLAVDRSAMSAELSRMQKEGLLEYHRSTFTLHHS